MANLFSGALVVGIDPGPEFTAYAIFDGQTVIKSEIRKNAEFMLELSRILEQKPTLVGIEKIASYGMAVGEEVFETCVFTGRILEFIDQWNERDYDAGEAIKYERFKRKEIVQHICRSTRANDANVRAALIDRVGPPTIKKLTPRFGKKGQELKPVLASVPGPTFGVTKDQWAALAVAVLAWDTVTT